MRSLLAVGSMIISLVLLQLGLKTLPVGTDYAIWTGIGAVGIALPGTFSPVRVRKRRLLVAPGQRQLAFSPPTQQPLLHFFCSHMQLSSLNFFPSLKRMISEGVSPFFAFDT